LRDHTPAAGTWRGGLGSIRQWTFAQPVIVSASGDLRIDPPRGVFGGEGGQAGAITLAGADGSQALPARFGGLQLAAGDTITIEVPSGGGYGDPLARDPDAVARDVSDGLCSLAAARDSYGVVIDPATGTADEPATSLLRQARTRSLTD
jgi:N-methylhydantoinase B/oxoprolinase/acetone carboxylase alpha subunit